MSEDPPVLTVETRSRSWGIGSPVFFGGRKRLLQKLQATEASQLTGLLQERALHVTPHLCQGYPGNQVGFHGNQLKLQC
ncbi:Hypp176 [Branchiostoma lanceolatum]|uniref:Hypp176 protein n=1 Tax=Branchiostoma lanceolatum TaxID=7740 RepID=A0A8J9YHY4_BRALA|nr:Hypp176 [Branchiostoma lanceolatum]